jgi:adenine-specific DNA-methyltransferase
MLDVFSGMCSVGEAVGPVRPVWTNDAQVFASEVGAALFTSQTLPLRSQAIADTFHTLYRAALSRSQEVWASQLAIEQVLLEAPNFDAFDLQRASLLSALQASACDNGLRRPNLFARQYAESFFGLSQALEIDAIVEAVRGQTPSPQMSESQRWLMIALGRTMLRISTTTGHFAQYLNPKPNNFRTFQRQRRRRVWTEWLESSDELDPIGSAGWRKQNIAFNEDTLLLIPKLKNASERPSVVYADPPYTNDQYSRYYHLLETLILYDYPSTTGAGLYRNDRFVTRFSLKSQSASAISSLISSVSQVGSDLVLSYPTNGLAYSKGINIEDLLRRYFRSVEVCHAIAHDHSTFGASKGPSKSSVIEKIYLGRS